MLRLHTDACVCVCVAVWLVTVRRGVIRFLVLQGVEVDAPDATGLSAMHLLVARRDASTIATILNTVQQARPTARLRSQNSRGEYALDVLLARLLSDATLVTVRCLLVLFAFTCYFDGARYCSCRVP